MPKFELSSEGGAVGSGGGGGLFCRGIIVGFCLGGGGGVALGAYFWPVAGDLVIFDGIYFCGGIERGGGGGASFLRLLMIGGSGRRSRFGGGVGLISLGIAMFMTLLFFPNFASLSCSFDFGPIARIGSS